MNTKHDQRVQVVMTGHGRGEIFIDGVKVEGVRRIEVRASVHEANRVVLDFKPTHIEMAGMYDVSYIGQEQREHIIAAGVAHGNAEAEDSGADAGTVKDGGNVQGIDGVTG